MIEPEARFWISCRMIDGGPTLTTIIVDWDQRREYQVDGPKAVLLDEEGLAITFLAKHIDTLDRSVHTITVDGQGCLLSTSANAEDDPTNVENLPCYYDAPSLRHCLPLEYSKLNEIERLWRRLDVVSYEDNDSENKEKIVVFKYAMLFQWRSWMWIELHMLKGIPKHPNLILLDRVVVDDESQVIGFTVPYVAGGNLEETRDKTFRLKWFDQLTAVVDYLNLEVGVMHQDVAPRNLLVEEDPFDPEKNRLRLFDFNRAVLINDPHLYLERNDVAGVVFTLYEIVTDDEHFRTVPFDQQNPRDVLDLEEWPQKRPLDHDLSLFRQHLTSWIERRGGVPADKAGIAGNIVPAFEIPEMPPPRPVVTGIDDDGRPILKSVLGQSRSQAIKYRPNLMSWVRPPAGRVPKADETRDGVLATLATCVEGVWNSIIKLSQIKPMIY